MIRSLLTEEKRNRLEKGFMPAMARPRITLAEVAWKSFMEFDRQREYLALATYLPRKSYWAILSFIRQTRAIQSQLESSNGRSEEHTSELQSQFHLVCRLLLEKKNI